MLFNSLICSGLALLSVASAGVVREPLAKRQEVDTIYNDLLDLQETLTPIEEQLDTAVSTARESGETDEETWSEVTDLLTQMDTALSTAGADFEQLQKRGLIIRQEDNGNYTEIADLVAGIVTDILSALDGVQEVIDESPVLGALLSPIISAIDVDLAIILTGLGLVLSGVLRLVADLLSGLGEALSGLGGSASGALGL